ncbi:type II toxin-antitoxin system HicA family toxin [Hymenobacter sp. UYP22]|uniref:type II toxin-antitoxin system HicA family toxin n=1 Tax=Hymenobacter sp. UYP22 TaxID=3156348 RepID=UPI00339AAA55
MSKLEKFVATLLSGYSDKTLDFTALCGLLLKIGFSQRIRGSHHIFTKEGVEEIINLQPTSGGVAKPYQVKQVRELLQKYDFTLTPAPGLRVISQTLPTVIIPLKPKK